MATLYSTQKTKWSQNVPSDKIKANETTGRVRIAFADVTLASASSGDVVEMVNLPNGARIIDGYLSYVNLGASTTLSVGNAAYKNAAGTATGFIGWFAYSGAAFAGFPFGLIAQSWGWDLFFTVICICAVFSVLLLMPLWSATKATVHRAQKKRVAGNIIDPTEEPLNL